MANIINGTSASERLDGTVGDDEIYGHEGDDELFGFGGHDILDGGTGADTMTGGTGDDWYYVDNASDVIVENANEGTDVVFTSLASYSIASLGNVEYLYGDASDQTLTGNSLRNVIDGDLGADTMIGGLGDDYYVVDNIGDVVVENAGEGNDTIYTTLGNFSIADMPTIENLEGAFGLDDNLTGNSGNNIINGWTGADTMIGGAGNDSYMVDDAGDTVVELSGQGTDRIISEVDYSLSDGQSIETMSIAGGSNGGLAVSLTGNDLDQVILGNAADNVLVGNGGSDRINAYSGDDTVIGGAGHDTLFGGVGNDMFVFDTPFDGTYDSLKDFSSADDTIVLDQSIFDAFAAAGAISAEEFHLGGRALDANDHIIYNQAKGALYYDPDGSGPEAQHLFAWVTAGTEVFHTDFFIG